MMISKKIFTFLIVIVFTCVIPNFSSGKQQSCQDFEKYFKRLAALEREFSSLKRQKSEIEGIGRLLKKAGIDLLELRVPLVAMDPQKDRPNHFSKCRSASEAFLKELPDAQKSLMALRAFDPMMG